MHPVVELLRLEENEKYGTFGLIKINKEVFSVCLEPPDYENQVSKSSIPVQQYMCKRIVSPTFGETFEITNVPGRTHVLFHKGNFKRNTEACVLLAQYWGKLRTNERLVVNSGTTFQLFMEIMRPYNEFHLTISEHF